MYDRSSVLNNDNGVDSRSIHNLFDNRKAKFMRQGGDVSGNGEYKTELTGHNGT